MRHVWDSKEWQATRLGDIKFNILARANSAPKLGDLSVRELCCLAKNPWCPVGIYAFIKDDSIIYTGKTHGRSFHERMVSHLDHRDPIAGSPHLAQLVQSMIRKGDSKTAEEAVSKVLDMNIIWLPVPKFNLSDSVHKILIALIERRLLWEKCLNPRFNSPRVKKNDTFMLRGYRYNLSVDQLAGDVNQLNHLLTSAK
tara:strand:+ start:34599 stop:35192 length:594 start_codon:yes stop_codon:yes gene_type:complete